MQFTVLLSKASSQKITVKYATQNGTATAGSDYVAKSGTLTFAARTTKQSISITVNGDKTPEANETFNVLLSNAVNAQINDAVGLGTITNDDGTATITSARPAQTDNQQGNPSVKVSPNPATSILNAQLSGYSRNVTFQLLNAYGVVLKQEKVQTLRNALQINVTDVSSGVYYVAVIDDKGNRQTEKVIVAR
ncbi:MAG: Calx-beta domain-containing protein [Segetibacter sp.]